MLRKACCKRVPASWMGWVIVVDEPRFRLRRSGSMAIELAGRHCANGIQDSTLFLVRSGLRL